MKLRYTALAAAIALLAASSAQAVETWQFNHVTLTGQDNSALTLLSQSDTATVLSMTSAAYATTLFEAVGASTTRNAGSVLESFGVDVADGYHVTGVSLHVDMQGKLDKAAPNGYAYNSFTPEFYLTGGFYWGYQLGEVQKLNGVRSASATLEGFNSDDFTLNLKMKIETAAAAAYTFDPVFTYTDPSSANIWADNITVTIHTVPVPEPSTYVMLGAGLALLGGLARRQRAA